MPTVPVEKALNGFLRADAAVAALAGDRVYAGWLKSKAAFPAVTYIRVSADREASLDGPLGRVDVRIQVDCWAKTYGQAKVLAEAVRRRLHGFRGVMVDGADSVSVGRSVLISETDLSEAQRSIYRVSQDYQISQMED